ncbi:MAG: HEAT repeat domain-containing protein [Maioricimonas sp. JB049]
MRLFFLGILGTGLLACAGEDILPVAATRAPASRPDADRLAGFFVKALVENDDEPLRAAARDGLLHLGPHAGTALVSQLTHPDGDDFEQIALLLERVGTFEIVPALQDLYTSNDDVATRRACLQAIAAIVKRTSFDAATGRPIMPAVVSTQSIVGTWSSNWGPVTIRAADTAAADGREHVVGSWIQGAGMNGIITRGAYDPSTRVFEYAFSEPWHSQTGTARLTRSVDGRSMSGTWTFDGGGGGSWTMER